jgi:hypothetical protein
MRRGRIAAGVVGLVAVGSFGLAGCLGPAPPSRTVSCSSAGDGTPTNPASASNAIAECHKQIKGYTTSSGLMSTARSEAAERQGMLCQNGALVHSPPGGVAENLYCWYTSAGCQGSDVSATKAMNAWLASAGHNANINNHNFVGAGVTCTNGHYFAVAHYQ